MAQDQHQVLPVSAEGLPRGSATPSHGLTAPGARMLSLPEVLDLSPDVPHIPPGTGGCSCGEGAAGRAGTPRQPPGNQGLSPQPRMCQGQREVPHTGTAWLCPSQVLGWDGQEEARRRKRCGCAQGQMQRHSLIPGGLPGTQPSWRYPLPSSAHPWSVQCPKEAKETRGGRDGGEHWRPPVQAVFLWVQARWGSLPALQPPQHSPLPSSAHEGL